MVGLALVVFAEKLGIRVTCLALAVLVVFSHTVAHKLIPATDTGAMTTGV